MFNKGFNKSETSLILNRPLTHLAKKFFIIKCDKILQCGLFQVADDFGENAKRASDRRTKK